MPKPKFDRVELNRLLSDGKPQSQIAQFFGVSEGAISKAKKELNVAVVKNVVLESAHKVVNKHLDTLGQLQKINQRAHEILDTLTESQINQKLDAILSTLLGSQEQGIAETRTRIQGLVKEVFADQSTALKACAEIRQQLELQLEIFKTLHDFQEVEAFQQEVLDAIQSVSPELKNTIIRRLKERGALRPSAVFSGG